MEYLAGKRPNLVGVSREPVYSPGKVEEDMAILAETVRACEDRGACARIVSPDAPEESFAGSDLVFAMCQGPRALETLRRLTRAGLPVVHDAAAIEACHRKRMLPLLSAAGLPRPRARIVSSANPEQDALDWVAGRDGAGIWIKRGDVHATQTGDVVYVKSTGDARAALNHLAERGIADAAIEAHVPGRTLKFYGVRGTRFFRAFDGDGSAAAGAMESLAALGDSAAAALNLAIYGGDFIVDESGRAVVVDVNDWPSFSRCRTEAARAISQHLLSRVTESGEVWASSSLHVRSPA